MILSEELNSYLPTIELQHDRCEELLKTNKQEILNSTKVTLENQIVYPPLDDPLMTNFSIVALKMLENDHEFNNLILQAITNRINEHISVEPKVMASVTARAISAIMIRQQEYDFTKFLKTVEGTETLLRSVVGDFTDEYLELISREVPQTNIAQRSIATALIAAILYGTESNQDQPVNLIDIGSGYGNLGLYALATNSYRPVLDYTPDLVSGRLWRNGSIQYNHMVGIDIAPAYSTETESWVTACDTFKNLSEKNIKKKLKQLHEWKNLPNVSRVVGDAFYLPFAKGAADITTSSVWMYMLNDEQRKAIFRNMDYVTHPEHGIQVVLEHTEGIITDDNGRDAMKMTRKWGKYPVGVHIFGPEITQIYGRERMLRPFVFPNTRCERLLPGADYEEAMTLARILRRQRS